MNNAKVSATNTNADTSNGNSTLAPGRFRRTLLLWFLFFLICLGLGYPTLKRYDPATTEGLSDTNLYKQLVTGGPQNLERSEMRGRLLVPFVAKPFYRLAQHFLPRWNPVFFGLLVANSLFCATTACLLASIGDRLFSNHGMSLLAATLYLLNFAVPNEQLAGMIDSSESCLLLALTWTLLFNRWAWLPLWGVVGPLAKETFVPFACVFTLVWWMTAERHGEDRFKKAAWVIAMGATSVTTLIVVHSIIAGHTVWPWELARSTTVERNYFSAFWRTILGHGFWYVFGWLLPLGIWKLKRLPREWVMASMLTGLTALALGIYKGIPVDNMARPIFNAVGPILSLSVAVLLAGSSTHGTQEGQSGEHHNRAK